MSHSILLSVAFASGAFAVAGVASAIFDLFLRDRSEMQARLQEAFPDRLQDDGRKSPLFKDLDRLASEASSESFGWRARFGELVEQSGVSLSAQGVLTLCLLCGLAGIGLGIVPGTGWPVALVVAPVGLVLPLLWLHQRRQARIRRLRVQLPEAFELMSRALRTGQTPAGAFLAVAENLEPPLAEEFSYCHEQQNLGLSQEVALRDLGRRTGVIELQMFVVAMLVQRQTGGNPVEILNNLSDVVRKRSKLASKVGALTAEGRLQAAVLMILPVVVFFALYILNPDYIQPLLESPQVLAAVFGAEVLGGIWIRNIVRIDD